MSIKSYNIFVFIILVPKGSVMFEFLFKREHELTNNSKKVKRWKVEHQSLATYAMKVVEAYDKEDKKKARKHLDKLQVLALNHLMDEDVTFFELCKNAKTKDEKILCAMKEFRRSFIDTKRVLFHFFIFYTNPKNDLDNIFRKKLDAIIGALVKRMEFEESNLYSLINH